MLPILNQAIFRILELEIIINNKFEKIKKIRIPGRIISDNSGKNKHNIHKDGRKIPFLSSNIRPCLADEINNETMPGPGAYDLNFRDELKTLGKYLYLHN